MSESHVFLKRRPLGLLFITALLLGASGVLSAQQGGSTAEERLTPDVPALIIPEELRLEADRLEAEEDDARAAREDAEEARLEGSLETETRVPRIRDPARRLSDLHRDERSVELLRVDCRSDLSRRDITLFANGTIRLRRGPWDAQEMLLEELGPEELTTYLRRLLRLRRSDEFPDLSMDRRFEVEGEWTHACRLGLDLPGEPPVEHLFSPLEMQPLALGNILQTAEELADFTRPMESPDRLPVDYEPLVDDVLRGRDGVLYRVISPTDDGEGVELESLAEPLVVYYRIADLPGLFVARVDSYSDLDWEERVLAEPEVMDLEDLEGGFAARGKRVVPWDQDVPTAEESGTADEEPPRDRRP